MNGRRIELFYYPDSKVLRYPPRKIYNERLPTILHIIPS